MRAILRKILSWLLTFLTAAGVAVFPAADETDDVRTFTTDQAILTYTVRENGEAVVESIVAKLQAVVDTLAIPPFLDGCPVTSVIATPSNYQYYYGSVTNLILPANVRSFTSKGLEKSGCFTHYFSAGTLYCFGSDTVIDATKESVGKVCCFAGTQTESSVPDGIPAVPYAPEQFENDCLFTGSVVDMIAPQAQTDFVVPETLGGKTVTAVHAEALANRCDLASVELPSACSLLDLDGDYLEDGYRTPALRCVFNGPANRMCYRYLLSCVQLLPDGSEHFVDYDSVVNGTSSLLPGDATFLDWEIRDGEVYITGLDCHMVHWEREYYAPEDIVIPASLDGCPVVSVGGMEGDSYKDGMLESEIILHSVTLPPTVREIEAEAFLLQEQLTSINVENVEIVGKSAFSGCSSLTELRFGKKLKKLEDSKVFCTSTGPRIYFDPDCPLETIYSLPDVHMDTLTLPNHVKTICGEAYWDNNVHTIIVPASVERIGQESLVDVATIVMLSRNAELAEPEQIPFSDYVVGSLGRVDDQQPTIYCYENSTAHAYAQKNDVPFVLLDDSALLLDGEPQAQTICLAEPMEKDAFLRSLSVRGEAQMEIQCGDVVTTGAAVTLIDPVFGHTEHTYTVVCPGDTDADGVCYTQADLDIVRRISAGLITQTEMPAAFAAADVYRDGLVNTTDVARMRTTIAGL